MVILFGLALFLFLFPILFYRRSKRERQRRKEFHHLMEKWQHEHWKLTSLGKPNDRDILQHAPQSAGIIILGKEPLSEDAPYRFNPVFVIHTQNCQQTLLAFSRNRIEEDQINPDNISSYSFALDSEKTGETPPEKRVKHLNQLFTKYM